MLTELLASLPPATSQLRRNRANAKYEDHARHLSRSTH